MFCAFLLGSGLKIGGNLSEDPFFCSSPNFERKIGLNLIRTMSDSDLCSSQIFCPPLPPFQNSAYATGCDIAAVLRNNLIYFF